MAKFCVLVILAFLLINLTVSFCKAGESKGEWNPIVEIIAIIIINLLLYWGAGLFNVL